MKLRNIFLMTALCATSAIAQTSGINRANMDFSAKPGTDFFKYAGGGWMSSHPLDAEHSRYGQFNVLNDLNEVRLRDMILDIASKEYAQGTLEQKIGSLYRLSMDSVRRNSEGAQPIIATLDKIHCCQTKQELFVLIAQLSRENVPTFFGVGVGADEKNATQNLVQISQAGLSLGDRDYYLSEEESTLKIREAYKDYMQKLFALVGDDVATAIKKQEQVLAIETQLASPSYSRVQMRNPEANYHKLTYAQLLIEYPGIDWSTFFLQSGFCSFDEICVGQPEPIHEVEKIWQEKSLEELKAYTEFKLINSSADYLSDDFRSARFELFGHQMQGIEQDRPRWKRAVSIVEGVMGMAVGKMYVERYFPESSKQRMLELVKNLQVALGERIDKQEWMSEETKKAAHEKLATFYVKIGYPDVWRDYSSLEIDESLSYIENLRRASRWNNDNEIAEKVGKPVDKNEWFMTPQTINAYYNPTTNEICFPAGILQAPFFDPEADDAVNYGAIGVVIGHEMTHGFDDQGAQYDKDGNLHMWWKEEDFENFKTRTGRMANFFNKLEILPGLCVNGQLTVGENMADHGGLMVAYQALQNVQKQKGALKVIDGFTPDQRFFLSYGLIWAQNAREAALRQLQKIDPHSPARFRVNGALPHIDQWYKAFNIKKSDKLYVAPKNRVVCW